MSEQEIEIRRRKVQEYLMKGYIYDKIAEKLGVHVQTIQSDVKILNERYKKLVVENPNYLNNQLEKIFQFIDHFQVLISELWELKEQCSETIEVTDKNGVKKTISIGSIDDQRKILMDVKSVMEVQAKILKLISGSNQFVQQNYIHIDQVNNMILPIMNIVKEVVNIYVPEEKKEEAFNKVKEFMEVRKIEDIS